MGDAKRAMNILELLQSLFASQNGGNGQQQPQQQAGNSGFNFSPQGGYSPRGMFGYGNTSKAPATQQPMYASNAPWLQNQSSPGQQMSTQQLQQSYPDFSDAQIQMLENGQMGAAY